MSQKVTIAVDAMGGDHAPDVVLEGVAAALAADADISVVLCGPKAVVEPFAASHERCRAQVTDAGHRHGRAPRPSRSQEEGFVAWWWAAAW